MDIKPLRTPEDHSWALCEIEKLWDEAIPGTPAGDRFEILLVLTEAYERQNFPVLPPDPVEAIKFRMEQQGLNSKDLQPIIGTSARVSEILSYKRQLSLQMIRRINEKLDIPLKVLVVDYKSKKPKTLTGKKVIMLKGKSSTLRPRQKSESAKNLPPLVPRVEVVGAVSGGTWRPSRWGEAPAARRVDLRPLADALAPRRRGAAGRERQGSGEGRGERARGGSRGPQAEQG